MKIKRFAVIVLDGVGAGELPDAEAYGDVGSNSLSNTARVVGGLDCPNMGEIGLGNITPIEGVPAREETRGRMVNVWRYPKARTQSPAIGN